MRGSRTPPAISAGQGGVFTAAQARDSGYSTYRIRNLVREGRWVVVLGSVYAVATRELTQASLARAALLAAGTGSVASHVTAARLWHLTTPPDPEVHVIVRPEVRLKIAGLRTHRLALAEAELAVVDQVLCTSLDRTVTDCMLWLPEEAGRALVVDAIRRRLVSVESVRSGLLAVGQRHGLARAWSVLRDVEHRPFSEAEVRAHRVLGRAGVAGWTANAPVYDEEGLIGVVDVRFDDVPLVIEIDGRAHHTDDDAFQRDRSRQNRLARAGYTVLRFTWDDVVSRPAELVQSVRDTVARLNAEGSRRADGA